MAPMGEDDLRAAIEEPARLAGSTVEPALVELLVHEVTANPGALPMLSHALQETWQRREGRHSPWPGTRPRAASTRRWRGPPSRSTPRSARSSSQAA